MAWSIVGSTGYWGGVGAVTIDKPANVAQNDVLVVFIGVTSPGGNYPYACSGWTTIYDGLASSNIGGFHVLWKQAGGSEPANYTFTASNYNNTAALMVAVRGADPMTPYMIAAGQTAAANNPVACPAVTTTANDALLLCGAFGATANFEGNDWTWATATEINQQLVNSGGLFPNADVLVSAAYRTQAVAGSTGTTLPACGNVGPAAYCGVTVALNPFAPNDTLTYVIPEGTTIAAGGKLVFWLDDIAPGRVLSHYGGTVRVLNAEGAEVATMTYQTPTVGQAWNGASVTPTPGT